MTTSQNTWSISNNKDDLRPSATEKAYARALFRRQVHDQILAAFMDFAEGDRFARSTLADRLGLNRSQVTRWLAGPSNLRTDTISDLLLAMSYKPKLSAEKLSEQQPPANYVHENSTATAPSVSPKSSNESSSSREPSRPIPRMYQLT